MFKFLVGFDAIIALSWVHIALILGDLIAQLENAVLLMKKHIVIVLNLDLSHFFRNSLIVLLHLVALRICQPFELFELLVS
jgi:hypothetical protein